MFNSKNVSEIAEDAKNIELATDLGTPLLEVCIDAEDDGPNTPFKEEMQKCLHFLLSNDFEPQTQDIFKGETMLFKAIVERKYDSANVLLDFMKDKPLKFGRNQMNALSATVISPNIHYFKSLVNWDGKKVNFNEL